MRRPSAALVLSSAALFVALGGPAAAQRAAQKISGASLVNNSVTGSKIRDGSLTATDFSARARGTLKTPANRSVTAAKLRPNAVRSAAIARGAVGASKLAAGADDAVALVTPPANWPAAMQVTALLGPGERSVSVLACNFTGAPADPGPVSFRYLLFEL